MSITIKLSPIKSYNHSNIEHTSVLSEVYKVAKNIFLTIKQRLKIASSFVDKIIFVCENKLITVCLKLFIKTTAISIHPINHGYNRASIGQKQTLMLYLGQRLQHHWPNLQKDKIESVAHKIATDAKIFDLQGLCLGYAWLFAAYVLTHQDTLKEPQTIIRHFTHDQTIQIAPIISFASHVDFSSLVKVEDNDHIVIQGQALRKDELTTKKEIEAIKALQAFAYPSFNLDFAPTAQAIKATIADARAFLNNKTPLDNKYITKISHDMSYIGASNLKDQILACSSLDEKKAYIINVPTDNYGGGHAMSIYTDPHTNTFLFFDPNLGIISFPSLKDLAKGVAIYSKFNYGASKAYSIDTACI